MQEKKTQFPKKLKKAALKARELPKKIKKRIGGRTFSQLARAAAEKARTLPAGLKNKKNGQKHSLMTWLLICFMSFSLIILVVTFAIQMLFFGSFFKAIKTKTVTSCAASIESNIDNSDIFKLMVTISKQNDFDIMLCKRDEFANQRPVFTSIVNNNCHIDSFSTNTLNEHYISAKNNSGTYITVSKDPPIHAFSYSDFEGEKPVLESEEAERLIYAASLENDGGEFLLLIEAVVTPPRSTMTTLLLQIRIIMVMLFTLSIIITVLFSKMISKPLENINNSAKELATGDYDVEFNGTGYKEVEQLSETLNYATNELRQVDQMRKDLIANVSHDLRTPLTLITGYGEVMKDIPGENTPENIQIIIDEATRLTSLVNDLIDISKIEAGTMKLEASLFCITDTIEEMFGRYNKLKEQDGFSFTLEHDQKVWVYADQLKISQVIYNLVNNAVNYAGENKEITVRQICYDNRVRIEVIDNGPGIPPDKLKNIWDRYYKVDKSHRTAKVGTGLGLSIVKTVLKLHKAQYGVFSKVGKGTVFWFELVRTKENGEPL